MTVVPFSRAGRPRTGAAPPLGQPVQVSGSFDSPTGRAGTFLGEFRLERLARATGRLAAAGVVTGELTDSAGRRIGIGARRTTAPVDTRSPGTALLVRVGPLEVDLLGFLVSVGGFDVEVRDWPGEPAARRARRLSSRPPVPRRGGAGVGLRSGEVLRCP